ARAVADFHRAARGGVELARFGCFDAVAGSLRGVLEQARSQVGSTLPAPVWERLPGRMDEVLARLHPLIEARAERGATREGHGDLHLEHIYPFPDRPPPGDVLLIDCLEFNERLRCTDPVADMAFTVMDLRFRGRADLAGRFAAAYFEAAGDAEGRALLPLYT